MPCSSSTLTRFTMLATVLIGFSVTDAVLSAARPAAPPGKVAQGTMTAAQIVDRNMVARGGLEAWRGLQTQTIAGHMDAGAGDSYARSLRAARGTTGATGRKSQAAAAAAESKQGSQQVELPFRMELKRPNKSRLEIDFAGKTAVQVYDGKNGWKVRPFLNRDDAEPFTEQAAKSQSTVEDMRGTLLDDAARGTKVELEGKEAVEGHNAYKLKLTMKSGDVKHVWIDAQSFLDVKVEGTPRMFNGHMRNVWIYQRNFHNVKGLNMPFVYETALDGVPDTHKMTFESVTLNQPIDDARFAKPQSLPKPPAPPSRSAAPRSVSATPVAPPKTATPTTH
jgi:outer membrane lipoprotein-sorting protein